MAVRGEEVASSIDARVREAIERMVAEIHSSIDDVRVAVDSQLKAALQSVQADVKSISFLPDIQKSVTEFEQSIAGEAPAPAPVAAPAAADAGRLRDAIRTIERGKSQVDVLNSLLDESLAFGSRAALLILRGETFSGWKGVGFNAAGGNDESVKRFNAAPGLIPELDQVLRAEHVVEWDGANLSTRLGVPASTRAVLVPMVIKDKVAAAVYVDATDEDVSKLDSPSLQLLVFTTGLLIDTLAMRKKTPSPSLLTAGDSAETMLAPPPMAAPAPRPAAPAPQPAAPPAAAPRPAPPQPVAAPRPAAPAPAPAPAPPPAPAPAPKPAAAPELPSFNASRPGFSTPTADDLAPSAPPAARPEPPKPRTATSPGLGADDRPSTQYVPPAGVGGRGAAAGAQTEEGKKHDEARRFARLLVSEIKLYNESKVDQGRKNRDLYERLKEDIDRSRQMYDERISDDVRKGSNYFYDELVRILADGDSTVLGL